MVGRLELVFGLVGPIGCPIKEAGKALETSLARVGYSASHISISESMAELLKARGETAPSDGASELENKIKAGNLVRMSYKSNAVLAGDAIQKIRNLRGALIHETDPEIIKKARGTPRDNHAFIINQLKRPEEVELLTRVFGKRFVQVSVVTPLSKRIDALNSRLMAEQSGWTLEQCEDHTKLLVRTDQDESDKEDRGQRISKIFHLGDVFLDGRTDQRLADTSNRFVDAFFGKNSIGPTRDEYGSYVAKGNSLRSVDLSRQVGAAIFNKDGDLIASGCNDVPKPLGGIYWDEDTEKQRDIDIGGEANKREVNRIVFDFLDTLGGLGLLPEGDKPSKILEKPENKNAILESLIGGITEYGRMVHAEMNALADAARLGLSIKNATIYVTTYPCHNCAKHLVAAGVSRIVFIEPYPKSKAEVLFRNIIEQDNNQSQIVSIEHFYGISPRRFRDIFEKGKRQSKSGKIDEWYLDRREPRLGPFAITSTEQEVHAIKETVLRDV